MEVVIRQRTTVRRYCGRHLRRRGHVRCDHSGTGDGLFSTLGLSSADSQASGGRTHVRRYTGISARRVRRLAAGPSAVL